MLRYLGIVLILLLSGCGVDTSSSTSDSFVIDPTQDGNTTDNNTTDSNGTIVVPDPIFDTLDAIYDPNGCNVNSYRVVSDASYAGDLAGENGADSMAVVGEGLWIASEYLEADPNKSVDTWVSLFYKPFPDTTLLGDQGVSTIKLDGVFQLVYDVAWSDASIDGLDNTVYVQSNKTELPSCYRMTLNDILGENIQIIKVYR